jgi:hypothetical protein
MDYLGLFCLGAFVGAIATAGLRFVSGIGEWQKVLALILPAVLSGVAIVFVNKFKYSPAVGCYPLGLLVALLWAYSDRAMSNVRSTEKKITWLGYAHLFAAVAVSFAAGIVVTLPVIWQLQDEYRRAPGDTLLAFKDQMKTASACSNTKNIEPTSSK